MHRNGRFGRVLVTVAATTVVVRCKAPRVQFFVIVQDEVREELRAGHVLCDHPPVVHALRQSLLLPFT